MTRCVVRSHSCAVLRLTLHPSTHAQDRTPLHWAVYKNHLILSEWLIRNKDVDIFVQDFEGRLPLHWAAAKDNLKCIETLVGCGCAVLVWR